MEAGRILIHILLISALILSALFLPVYTIYAYSAETTHPALTSETVELYNRFYPQTRFSEEEKQMLMSGSSLEDSPAVRVLNHFHDPVYDRGLRGYTSAMTWAQSPKQQAVYSGNFVAGVSAPLYSASSDYSWERSVYEYVHGDKKRALRGLGQILHLIQDLTVPPHVRDDPHPPALDFGSPYEAWTSAFTPQNLVIAEKLLRDRKMPVYYNTLNEYFFNLAFFTNTHFFSKDTLPFPEAGTSSVSENKYPVPQYSLIGVGVLSGGRVQKFGMGMFDGKSYHVFELQEHKDNVTQNINKKYSIDSKDGGEKIMADYWNILSKQAVLHGAGVIKLFFDEVEKEKQTLALYNKNKSFLSKFLPKQFAPSYTKGDVTPQQNVASVVDAFASVLNTNSEAQVIEEGEEEVENTETVDVRPSIEEKESVSKENALEIEEIIGVEEKFHSSIPDPIPVLTPFIGFGGDGGSSKALQEAREAEESSQESTEPDAPTITSPTNNTRLGTTTITFSGISQSNLVLSQDFSNATTSVDSNGDWEITLDSFSEGTTTVSFKVTDTGTNTVSDQVSVSVYVDTTLPTFSSMSVLACSYSLRSDACLSGSEEIFVEWDSTNTDVEYYGVAKDNVVVATTTAKSTSITVSNNTTANIAVVAYDLVGNIATSSSQSVSVATSTVVINEVAWAGTQASSMDEWIELYNQSSNTIDLSHLVLYATDLVPYIKLSGSVASGAYYLIERSNGSTTSESEDLTTVFSGVGSGSGLSNDGEKLYLVQSLGGTATSTLDATPDVSTCSGWCSGEATTTPISMERVRAGNSGEDASNWGSNNTTKINGTDSDGNQIYGTPKALNSATPPPNPGGGI